MQVFPPKSNLDSAKYGNQHSSIREEHIQPNMNGHNVQEVSIIYFSCLTSNSFIGIVVNCNWFCFVLYTIGFGTE